MQTRILRRISAYLIDLMFLGAVIMIIYYFIPDTSNTLELQSKLNNLNDSILSEGITFSDYFVEYSKIMYNLDKGRVIFSVINFGMIFIYFVIIPYITKGVTFGNYISGIRLKNINDKELSLVGLIFRNFVINGLGYLMAQIILVNVIGESDYFYILTIFAFIQILLVILSAFMIKWRRDGRGLHDILGGTVVVNKK